MLIIIKNLADIVKALNLIIIPNTPDMAQKPPIIFPIGVLGCMSPYPTLETNENILLIQEKLEIGK